MGDLLFGVHDTSTTAATPFCGILNIPIGFRDDHRNRVREALHTVRDPEIGKPIDEIGMLGDVDIDGDSSGCRSCSRSPAVR